MGFLLLTEGAQPAFAQLYMFDAQDVLEGRIRFSHDETSLDKKFLIDLTQMLNRTNALVKIFREAKERFSAGDYMPVSLRFVANRQTDGRLTNEPHASFEFAALIPNDNLENPRDIVVHYRSDKLKRISNIHPSYMALQYPLLFPFGEDGFRLDILHREVQTADPNKHNYVTMREYYAFRLQFRLTEGHTLLYGGRLLLQFIVDAWCCIEHDRLSWVLHNQAILRSEVYNNIVDCLNQGDVDPSHIGKRIVLPTSFTGGPRYMQQNYQDCMTVCRKFGNPDLFITFTFAYTIEFQKRGLPHVHILLWLEEPDKLHSVEAIDALICTEIPDQVVDPQGYEVVAQFMLHGPCGPYKESAKCMSKGKCTKHFPKQFRSQTTIDEDGFPIYRRRDTGYTIRRNGIDVDNRFIVPYNRGLIVKYQAHINVEWCNKGRLIKYLCKYVSKGPDRATIVLENQTVTSSVSPNGVQVGTIQQATQNEVENYLSCRYVSAAEACWRIFDFPIHFRKPFVQRLYFHLENEQEVRFTENESIPTILRRFDPNATMFIQWMMGNINYEEGRHLTYVEYIEKFRWCNDSKVWKPRIQKLTVVGRIVYAHPASGECFYLRMLLNIVHGVTSFEQIRTVNGIVYNSYKEACFHHGLLESDEEWHAAMHEASLSSGGRQQRELFVAMLLFCEVTDVRNLWTTHWKAMSEEILYMQQRISGATSIQLPDDRLQNLTLYEIDILL